MKLTTVAVAGLLTFAAGWYLHSNGQCYSLPDINYGPAANMCFIVWNNPATKWAWWKPGRPVSAVPLDHPHPMHEVPRNGS